MKTIIKIARHLIQLVQDGHKNHFPPFSFIIAIFANELAASFLSHCLNPPFSVSTLVLVAPNPILLNYIPVWSSLYIFKHPHLSSIESISNFPKTQITFGFIFSCISPHPTKCFLFTYDQIKRRFFISKILDCKRGLKAIL